MLSIFAVMIATMSLSVITVIWNGRHQVRTELAAALAVGSDSVRNDAALTGRTLLPGDVSRLVATFDGARNVQAAWRDAQGRIRCVSSTLDPGYKAPSWFVRLLSPHLDAARIPVAAGPVPLGRIELQPYARNEVSEVWTDLSEDLLFALVFFLVSAMFIYTTANRLVAPVNSLAGAIANIRSGRDGGRIAVNGPRELRRLIGEFNALAAELSASEAQRQALEDQLARLQDEERAELSRNLHDEVGPLLFLAKIDLLALARHADIKANPELAGSIAAASGTLSAVQMSLREVLNRLRPYEGLEMGLARALALLLGQWRARFTEIDFDLRLDGAVDAISERVQDALYRIAQEAISNAVRHARPRSVIVTLRVRDDQADLAVVDDGRVTKCGESVGLGMQTMRERAAGLGGRLIVEQGDDGLGWHVRARLPLFEAPETGMGAAE
jgi:two-component system sensor histidine kinase UhpB